MDTVGEPNTVTMQIDSIAGIDDVSVDLDQIGSGGVMVVKRGPNAGSRYLLDKDVVSAGRHPDSDIFLDDVTVSRRHVDFVRDDDGYTARDIGSLNGTYVNRERVEEGRLRSGDEVQIGKFKLVYLDGGD